MTIGGVPGRPPTSPAVAATSSGSRRWFGLRFLAVYAIWIACFQAVGRFAATLPTSDLTSAVDRAIPFEPGWVWAYELCYVLPFLPLAVVREEMRFPRALLAFAVANVTAFAVYLALPVAWPPTDPGSTLAGRVLALEQAVDFHPGANKLPSMHVVLAWLVFLTCRERDSRAGAAILLTTVAVTVSTLFVKQHIVADVAAGIAWAFGAWWAAGRLLPILCGETQDARQAFRRVALRAGIPALVASVALVALRAAIM